MNLELDFTWFNNKNFGITAGASTPDWIIPAGRRQNKNI